MVNYTPYHGLANWGPGDQVWDHSDLVEHVEATTPKSAPYSERPSSPPTGRLFWATDYRLLFRYDPNHQYADPDGWVILGGTGISTNPRPGTTYLTNVDVDATASVTDLEVTGTTTGISHTELGDVTADDHHTRYADTEAVSAVNAETSLDVDITGHAATAGDADTVDGYHGADLAALSEAETVDGSWNFTGGPTKNSDAIATEPYVDANSGAPDEIDVLGYGDPSNADQLLTDALADATAGDTLVFRAATYVFSDPHTINTPVDFEFKNGAEVDDQRAISTVGETLFSFQGPGVQHTEQLQADVTRGEYQIEVSGSGWVSEGDVLYIEDTTGSEPKVQHVVVDSVSGTGPVTITLEGAVLRDFTGGSTTGADVHRVDLMEPVEVSGVTIHNTGQDGEQIRFENCYRPQVDGLLATQHGRHTVLFVQCFNGVMDNCESRNAVARGSGEGEPFYVVRSTNSTFRNITTKGTRRGIDVALGSTGAHIENPQIQDFTKGGISVHDGDAVTDVTVEGGTIVATHNNDVAALSFGGAADRIHVEGTHIIAHQAAIYTTGRAKYEGLTIETAPNMASDPGLINVANGSSKVTVQADVTIPDYTQYLEVADTGDNSENIDLDLDIDIQAYSAGGNENPLIHVGTGCRNVEVSGDVYSLPDYGSAVLRLYGSSSVVENVTVDNLDIYNHGDQGIVLRGNAGVKNIRIRNSTLETPSHGVYIYGYDDLTTCTEFWFKDLNQLGSGNAVRVQQPADIVYVEDVIGPVDISSNATNVYIRP